MQYLLLKISIFIPNIVLKINFRYYLSRATASNFSIQQHIEEIMLR